MPDLPPHLVGDLLFLLGIFVLSHLSQPCSVVARLILGPSVSSLRDYFRLPGAQTEALLRTLDLADLGH